MKIKTKLLGFIVISILALMLGISGAQGQEDGVDRPGNDLKPGYDLSAADPSLCKKDCDADPNCRAYTYVKPNTIQGPHPRCWLKSDVPAAVNNECCISGIKGQEAGVDRPGNDLKPGYDLSAADPALCKKNCDADPNCRAYTYVKPNTIQGPHPRCWLKSDVPAAVNNDCCISGIKGIFAHIIDPALLSQRNFEYAPGRSGPTTKIDFYMSDKDRHATLTYEEIDGLAIFEGDIILGRSTDLQKARPRTSVPQCIGDVCSSTSPILVRFGETYLWPGGVIPYEIDPRLVPKGRKEIEEGIEMLTGATNLLLRPRNGERDYIVFFPAKGCSSWTGRQDDRQNVNVLNPGCGAGGVARDFARRRFVA